MPHRNTVIFNRLKQELENGENWVCFKSVFTDDIVEQLEDLGYTVKIGHYIKPSDGSEPYKVRDYRYNEYKEDCKFMTIVSLF